MTVVALVWALTAVVFGMLLLHALRDSTLPGWGAAAWLGLIAVILPNATNVVGTFTGGRRVEVDTFYNPVVSLTGPAVVVNEWASPLLLAFACGFVVWGIRQNPRINTAAATFVLLLVVAAIAAGLSSGTVMTGARLTTIALLTACIVIPRGTQVLMGAASGLIGLAILSLVAAAAAPEGANPSCDPRKCGIFGTLFTGVGDNHNAFGLLAAMSVPVVWFGLKRHSRPLAVLMVALALASGSRTAQIASIVTIVALFAADTRTPGRLRRAIPPVTLVLATLACVIIPFTPLSAAALTGRPGVWATAEELIGERPLLGHGGDYWRSLVDVSIIPRASGYSTHNQFLEILFVAGAVGVVIFTVAIVLLFVANRGATWRICALLLPVAICGIVERPLSLGPVDWLSWLLVVLTLVDFNGVRRGADRDEITSRQHLRV